MLYGTTKNGKERATKSGAANCPECNEELIPKCGEINIWHWAHRPGSDCNYDPGEMCAWHIDWQDYFDAAHSEVRMNGLVADVLAYDGTVIEFQHSSINTETIRKREAGHKKIVWVFDATEIPHYRLKPKPRYLQWRYPRKTWITVKKNSIYDLGGVLWVVVENLYTYPGLDVYGYWIKKKDFIHWVKTGKRNWNKPAWTKYTYAERLAYVREKELILHEENEANYHARNVQRVLDGDMMIIRDEYFWTVHGLQKRKNST